MQKNNVVLIGNNHHNGLGLVRSLGKEKVKAYGVIVGNKNSRSNFIQKSKYWNEVYWVDTYDDVADFLIMKFSNKKSKSLLIPWTDEAEKVLDQNYSRLKTMFILPSIKKTPGEIIRYMDKRFQTELFDNFQLNYLRAENYELTLFPFHLFEGRYPIILKPVTSVEGNKNDITVCYSKEQLVRSVNYLITKNYKRVLVQDYLEERTEYVLSGAVTNSIICGNLLRNIRQWPQNTGTGSFSYIDTNPSPNRFAEELLKKIQRLGYEGLIDFEFFEDKHNQFYINEINWRSSGRNFVGLFTNINTAFIYYCDIFGIECSKEKWNKKEGFTMNETMDIGNVISHNIIFKEWVSDLIKTRSFAFFDIADLRPALTQYFILIKEMIKKKIK